MNWISVKDRLPEEGVYVLTYLNRDKIYKLNYIIQCDKPIWACILERDEYKVTHWMPLPYPPTIASDIYLEIPDPI